MQRSLLKRNESRSQRVLRQIRENLDDLSIEELNRLIDDIQSTIRFRDFERMDEFPSVPMIYPSNKEAKVLVTRDHLLFYISEDNVGVVPISASQFLNVLYQLEQGKHSVINDFGSFSRYAGHKERLYLNTYEKYFALGLGSCPSVLFNDIFAITKQVVEGEVTKAA